MNLNIDLKDLNPSRIMEKRKAESEKIVTREEGGKQPPPRVNLLPSKYSQIAKDRGTRRMSVVGAGFGLIAVFAGSFYFYNENAKTALAVEEARSANANLTSELAKYAPVTNLARQTQALTDTVEAQTKDLIYLDQTFERFISVASQELDLSKISLEAVNANSTGSSCTSSGFEQVPLAGCISFSGMTSGGRDDIANLINALSDDEWFTDPFIPNAGESVDGKPVSVAGTVGVTMSALPVSEADKAAAQANEQSGDTTAQNPPAGGEE